MNLESSGDSKVKQVWEGAEREQRGHHQGNVMTKEGHTGWRLRSAWVLHPDPGGNLCSWVTLDMTGSDFACREACITLDNSLTSLDRLFSSIK